MRLENVYGRAAGWGLGVFLLAACAAPASPPGGVATQTAAARATAQAGTGTPEPRATLGYASGSNELSDEPWTILLERTPYPFTRPLPPDEPTILDGVYVKLEELEATPIPCRRCAPYRIEGGVWTMALINGVFRIYHPVYYARHVGSYAVEGDRLELFNDPSCPDSVGVYEWQLADGALTLRALDDSCPPGTRPRNLAHIAWQSCTPPTTENAVSGHWKVPEGC